MSGVPGHMPTTDPILFYKLQAPYGCFSNFSRDQVQVYGRLWQTSEHAFQGAKFLDPAIQERVWKAPTPRVAAELGRDRSLPLRADWESPVESQKLPAIALVKDQIMFEVCLAKFQQNDGCQRTLLGTADAELVEDSPVDSYWGWGSDHQGKNKLGKILMLVRSTIRGY